MCLSLRKTLRRGRCSEPIRLLRMPNLRRSRRFCLSLFLSDMTNSRRRAVFQTAVKHARPAVSLLTRTGAGEGFAGLELDDFAFVADAFAFVWLGLTDRPHLRGELADGLLVGAA